MKYWKENKNDVVRSIGITVRFIFLSWWWHIIDGFILRLRSCNISSRSWSTGVFDLDNVLVTCQVSDILFGRVSSGDG